MHRYRKDKKILDSKREPIDGGRRRSVPWFGACPGSQKPNHADHQIVRGRTPSHMQIPSDVASVSMAFGRQI